MDEGGVSGGKDDDDDNEDDEEKLDNMDVADEDSVDEEDNG